jgi:cytidylate kinase
MIRVITIEREYGAGGGVIAQKIAERLGWKLWDQLFTCEIARIANCQRSEVASREERVDPLYYRLIKSIMRGSFEGNLNLQSLHCLDADSIMVGRGSQHHLRNREDTLRIFLFAPREAKIRRLISEGMSEAEAQEQVDSVDQERAAFVEKYFHMEWPNRDLYHAMLNTSAGDETVVRAILSMKDKLDAQVPTVSSGRRA